MSDVSRLDATIEILGDLVAYPTVSSASNLALVDNLAERFRSLGARVEITKDETGLKANLLASLGPDVPGGVMLSSHSDVVPVDGQDWDTDPFVLTQSDGKLFGRGTCDMKGYVAAMVAMAPVYAAQPLRRPVHFAVTYDEELGCFGAQALARSMSGWDARPDIAFVGEPTMMRVVDGHKGCFEYSTRFTGKDGHGSRPDLGVNAVDAAVRYVSRIQQLQEGLVSRAPADCRFEPPWTTINVGALHGGTAHNIIAGHAQVDWEMRPVQPADARYVKSELDAFVKGTLLPMMTPVSGQTSILTEVIAEVEGLSPEANNPARDLALALTGENDVELVGFGTEAGLYQSAGMSVVVCGPGSIEQAHKPNEFLSIAQLERCLDMLHRLSAHLV